MLDLSLEELKRSGAELTAGEITQQPVLWEETRSIYKTVKDDFDRFFDSIKKNSEGVRVIFTGAGTSAYVGDTVTPYLNECYKSREVTFESVPTTTLVSNPYHYFDNSRTTLLVSFARSGNSPESVAAVEMAEEMLNDFYQVTITCSKDGQLARKAENVDRNFIVLMPKRANDKGFAMTGAFTTMTLSTLLLFDTRDEMGKNAIVNELIHQAEEVISRGSTIEAIADQDFDRIVYLGSGSLEALSKEAQLKMLELTAGEVVTAYESPLGFRHGPKSIVNDSTAVIVFTSSNDYTRKYELDLLDELQQDGIARSVWSLEVGKEQAYSGNCFLLTPKSSTVLPDAYKALAYVVFAQSLAFMTSVKKGYTPDNPSPSGTVNRVVKGVTIHNY